MTNFFTDLIHMEKFRHQKIFFKVFKTLFKVVKRLFKPFASNALFQKLLFKINFCETKIFLFHFWNLRVLPSSREYFQIFYEFFSVRK